jgi:hypothetical protein
MGNSTSFKKGNKVRGSRKGTADNFKEDQLARMAPG